MCSPGRVKVQKQLDVRRRAVRPLPRAVCSAAGAGAWGKAALGAGSWGRSQLPALPWWIRLLCGGEREPSALWGDHICSLVGPGSIWKHLNFTSIFFSREFLPLYRAFFFFNMFLYVSFCLDQSKKNNAVFIYLFVS